jgi:Na+/H+ antiporter NhaA
MNLSFTEDLLLAHSKLGILAGSLFSGVLGLAFLGLTSLRKKDED